MGYDALRKQFDPTGAMANVPDEGFLAYVADHGGAGEGAKGPTTPSSVFMAVPKMALGLAKSAAEDVANYPRARLVDPAVRIARAVGGIGESDPAKRAANAAMSPEEIDRDRRARAFETTLAMGGPVEKLAGATVGRIPTFLGRLLKNSATGAVLGGTDLGIRENSLGAVPAGAAGGAVLGGAAGELVHGVGKAYAKPSAEPVVAAPPAVPGVSEHFRMAEGAPPSNGPETVRALKNITMGYHHPFPLLAGKKFSSGESLSDAFVKGLQGVQDAEERGVLGASEFWHKQLTGQGKLKPEQMNLIRQHVTAASVLDDFQHGKKLPKDLTPKMLEDAYTETAIAISENPETAAAVPEMRKRYDAFHADLENRGYGLGYRKSYSPLKNVKQIDRFTPQSEASRRAGRTPSFMKERGGAGENRSYDVPKLMAEYETQYHRKIAEDELFTKIQQDPTVNLAATEEGRLKLRKDGIPEGYVSYEAPMGMPGHGKTTPGEPNTVRKATSDALYARKDLIQRAGMEADASATAALERIERKRRAANILEDNAKSVTKARQAAERSLEIAKQRQAKFATTGEGRLSRNAANATVLNREARLARLSERETTLIERAKKAQERVARTAAEKGETARVMKKKAASLMAKAEKVGAKAERAKRTGRKSIKLVIHRDIAESLSKFYPKPLDTTAAAVNKVGGLMARTATSLNPANTGMNVPSDLITTLAGPAGEKGTITSGIAARRLKEYPGALASMLKQSFGGVSEKANFGRKAGAVSGTFQHEIGAGTTPGDLKDFYYPEKMSARAAPGRIAKNIARSPIEFLQRTRNATEAAPRLATALEAKKRGLPPEEISRLAHESSLPYGSGTSAFAKSGLAKATARFATYPGLADVRIVQGAIKEGSRGRYAAMLTIPPAAAALWNTQDEEHSAAEKRLKPWVKSSLHVLVKKGDGQFDVYVIRADPFSEATQRWGLGQLSGRVVKAAKGVEPLSFKNAPSDIADAYGSMYPVGPLIESARGETKFHRKLDTPMKRIANLAPVVRLGQEAFEEGKKKGAGEALKMLLERSAGAGARRFDMKSVAGK